MAGDKNIVRDLMRGSWKNPVMRRQEPEIGHG